MQGRKTGGRQKGTPNKSTSKVKDFLDRVFTRAFAETRTVRRGEADVQLGLEDLLVEQIVTLTIDPKLLVALLGYYAGTPARQVDHTHSGTINIAKLLAGADTPDEVEDDEAEGDA